VGGSKTVEGRERDMAGTGGQRAVKMVVDISRRVGRAWRIDGGNGYACFGLTPGAFCSRFIAGGRFLAVSADGTTIMSGLHALR